MYLIIHLNTILLPLCADVHFVGAERDLGSSTQLQPTPCLLRYTTANPSLDWACTLCNKIKRLRIFHRFLSYSDIMDASEFSDFSRLLQTVAEDTSNSLLTILYLVVVCVCFLIPVLFYLRVKVADQRQRRLRDLELASAIEISLMSDYQHRESSGEARAARMKYRQQKQARVLQLFRPVEKILSRSDFHHLPRTDTMDLEQDELLSLNAPNLSQSDLLHDDSSCCEEMFVKIPAQGTSTTNKTRLVPGDCIICMTAYTIGDKVVWSSNRLCEHAFHSNCMESWLMKQRGSPLCPCCRQSFVIDSLDVEEVPSQQEESSSDFQDEYSEYLA